MAGVFTGNGEERDTALANGTRVRKDHPRVEILGALDELMAYVAFARVASTAPGGAEVLDELVADLHVLASELAAPPDGGRPASAGLAAPDYERVERHIREYEHELPPLARFVLPGRTEGAARLHLARVACRRAERGLATLDGLEPTRQENLAWLGRLSALLYVLARREDHSRGVADVPLGEASRRAARDP